MAAPSLPSLKSVDADPPSTTSFWGFLGATMAGNASFLAGFLHWLAIAFKWFLRLLLLLLAIGVLLGLGALIFGSLPWHYICRRGGRSNPSTDRDGQLGTEMVGLEFPAAEIDPEQDLTSDSGEEY